MKNRALPSDTSEQPDRELPSVKSKDVRISVSELKQSAQGWFLDCEIRRLSRTTLQNRRLILDKFFWFCQEKEILTCNRLAIRQFLAYLSTTHANDQDEDAHRWGNERMNKKVSAGTVATYHRILRTFFLWLVEEEIIPASPMATIAAPTDRPDDIQPFTHAETNRLLEAAHQSPHRARDEALLLFLLDTGVRATEICTILIGDLDMTMRTASVLGKGGKRRQVPFGRRAGKALWNYLKGRPQAKHLPVFTGVGGHKAGEPMTRSGVTQLIARLGDGANIQARCSAHTFRHTFAINFLMNGGNQMTLMQILGHTDVKMTARYVHFSQANVAEQHRKFSPADNMDRK